MSNSRRLDRISIPNPCEANWNEMDSAGANARFCKSCSRTVHDLSGLTRRQAADLIEKSAGKLCARITYDRRGTIEFLPAPPKNPLGRITQLALLGISAIGSETVSLAQVPSAATQLPSCHVEVKVLDSAGAVIPNADVTLTPQQVPQEAASGKTSMDGFFKGRVPAGHYALQVESRGFRTYREPDMHIKCELPLPVHVEVPLEVSYSRSGVLVVGKSQNILHRAWLNTMSFVRRGFA